MEKSLEPLKKIMVFDIPAVKTGALAILEEYYNEAVNNYNKDKIYYFILSLPKLAETDNVKVINFPWVKKSWFHRLYFDYFIAHKLVKIYDPDEIFSLQNIIIPRVKIPQTIYVHQSLPFINKRFKIFHNPILWIYQNLIGRIVIRSIKKAKKVIVQSNWMKVECVKKANVNPSKIIVIPPKININIRKYFKTTFESMHRFFYPASGFLYKNHKIIVDAALLLKKLEIDDYEIILTLKGDENRNIVKLHKRILKNNLPIKFIGSLTFEQVCEYYSKSILIFPSYIETFGLPLLEAKLHKTPILASDCPFSHEVLDEYENVEFFNNDDAKILASLLYKKIKC